MALVVQKYGGSSLATPEDIKRIARRVVEEHRKGNQMVVVVSAMGDTADHLIELAKAASANPPEREMDMLLSVGERTSIALLAMTLLAWGKSLFSNVAPCESGLDQAYCGRRIFPVSDASGRAATKRLAT